MITGVLTTSFPRYPGDFAGCFVEDAVRVRAAQGETVEVIAAGDGSSMATGESIDAGNASGNATAAAPERTVRVWRVPMPRANGEAKLFYGAGAPEILERGGPTGWVQALGFWAGLCERTRERGRSWDQVVAHWLVPCGLAARVAAPHLPLTAHAHSGDIALLERIPFGTQLARWLARDPCDLIFASANLRERFACLTGIAVGRVAPAASVCVRPAAASRPNAREIARRELGLDRHTVLAVGRLVPIKGFDVLLRAVALAGAHNQSGGFCPVMTLVILGDGPERARLEDLARRLKVDLRLPGFVPRGDVNRWMAGADIYVQPSRQLPGGEPRGFRSPRSRPCGPDFPSSSRRRAGFASFRDSRQMRAWHFNPSDWFPQGIPGLWPPVCSNPFQPPRRRSARKGGGGAAGSAAKPPTRKFFANTRNP